MNQGVAAEPEAAAVVLPKLSKAARRKVAQLQRDKAARAQRAGVLAALSDTAIPADQVSSDAPHCRQGRCSVWPRLLRYRGARGLGNPADQAALRRRVCNWSHRRRCCGAQRCGGSGPPSGSGCGGSCWRSASAWRCRCAGHALPLCCQGHLHVGQAFNVLQVGRRRPVAALPGLWAPAGGEALHMLLGQ